jgi:hypothetical protein
MSKRSARRVLVLRHVIALGVECWTLAEIGYYYTHDGDTLHGAIIDVLNSLSERLQYRASIRDTLDMIHDLPEQQE